MPALQVAGVAELMADLRSASASQAVTVGTADTSVGASGGTPALSYAAVPTAAHVLGGVIWSYSGTAVASGSITVATGTALATVAQWDVRAAGPDRLAFVPPIRGVLGDQMVVTAYPGGTANVVKLNALHWLEG